ncbi:MAG: hypothetical protein LBR90_03460 [Elusimicrobiota bacterium]|jgi:hypothetical protein|nr:hypothetical protein [Elusimicrobiota bacterium]
MKRLLLAAAVFILALPAVAAQADTYLIDAPTAEVMPVRTLGVNARAYRGGGLLTSFDFAVVNRFSLGASIAAEHLIGTNEQSIKVLVPSLQARVRFFDGGDILPALAAGFDNQGFFYDKEQDEYLHKGKGFYLVAGKEIFAPGLVLTPGVNVSAQGFEFYEFGGFVGAALNVRDIVNIMLEWDNIRSVKTSRLNGGLRFYLLDNFAMDFAVRNFNHKAERVAQLRYTISI